MDEIVYSNSGELTISDKTYGSLNSFFDAYTTTIKEYIPGYLTYCSYPYEIVIEKESKIDRAFKIVQMLMEDGHVKDMKVKEFVKLVGKVAEQL